MGAGLGHPGWSRPNAPRLGRRRVPGLLARGRGRADLSKETPDLLYAGFDHMVTGSVRVRPGQRVRTGQELGLLGNSGNTDGPHLHFGIQTRPDSLSASVPFEIDGSVLEGNVGPPPAPGAVALSGKPHRARRALPLIATATKLTPGRR